MTTFAFFAGLFLLIAFIRSSSMGRIMIFVLAALVIGAILIVGPSLATAVTAVNTTITAIGG